MQQINGFGQRLQYLIKNSDHTQKELSVDLHISEDSIGRYIKESIFPKIDIFLALCNYLNADIVWLLTGVDNADIKLSEEEIDLIKYYRCSNRASKNAIICTAKANAEVTQEEGTNLFESKIG